MPHPDYPEHPVRRRNGQNIHDEVIADLAMDLKSQNYTVKTNPGKSKEHTVARNSHQMWPDVFTVSDSTVTRIYEVETEKTVDSGSIKQWKDYAAGKAAFCLVVPKGQKAEARRLLQQNNIDYADILTF